MPPPEIQVSALHGGSNDSPAPALSVLIPTHNRSDALAICLEHLAAQTWSSFEVVVLDDGSADDTCRVVERFLPTSPFALRFYSQPNAGRARARNAGLALLRAPLCVLIGDDIFPAPDFLRTHAEHHRQHPKLQSVAVGLTRWDPLRQQVTPLMRWLESAGEQFAYAELLRGEPASWRHFYTSNLSAKTDYLRQNPFDESFAGYGMEDIELGYRLATRQHMQMAFLPNAVAEHLHPTGYRQTVARAYTSGAAAFRFGQLWPEQRYLQPTGIKGWMLRAVAEPRFVLPILTALCGWITAVRCPNPLLPRILQFHGMQGYASAQRRYADQPAPTGDSCTSSAGR